MIGMDAIRRAANNGATGPDQDEVLQVDTDAVAEWSMVISEYVVMRLNQGMPLRAGVGAAWAQGFMAGVAAAREDEGRRSK